MPYKARKIRSKLKSGKVTLMRHPDGRQTYDAMHPGDIPTGTFRNILKQAQLSEEEFQQL